VIFITYEMISLNFKCVATRLSYGLRIMDFRFEDNGVFVLFGVKKSIA